MVNTSVDQEFTFPTTDTFSTTIDSPPLWQFTTQEEKESTSQTKFLSKNFSSDHEEESLPPIKTIQKEMESKSQMEFLSKNFSSNHEEEPLPSIKTIQQEMELKTQDNFLSKDFSLGLEMEKMDKLWEDFNEELMRTISEKGDDSKLESHEVQDMRVSKSSKPSGFLMLIKILKRLFLLHSYSRSVKKQHNLQRSLRK